MKTGSVIASILLICGSVQAQDHRAAPAAPPVQETEHYSWADVLRVNPVYDEQADGAAAQPAHEECYEEQSTPSPPPSNARAGSTVLGALIGGVLGHTIGKGDGRKAATAVGVVAGAAVGNSVAREASERDTDYAATTQRHCRMVDTAPATQRRIVAYEVEYRYRGEVYMTRVAYDPGDRMRVRVSVVPAE